MTRLFQLFNIFTRWFNLFIISFLDMTLLFQHFNIFTLEYDTSFQSFNTFTLCPSFTCSQCCVSAQLWKWRLFESLCVHSGFPLSVQERGDQLLFTFLTPFIWGLGPKLWGQVLLYFTFIRLSALFFFLMFILLSMVSCERNEALIVCTCLTLSVQGERMGRLSGFWVFFVLISSLCSMNDQLRISLHYHVVVITSVCTETWPCQ